MGYLCGGIGTTASTGKQMCPACADFGEFERAMIGDQVKPGLAKVRTREKTPGGPRIRESAEKRVQAAR
jgi:DNA invertase Pin-like site-specific DNA recombinase